MDHIKKFNFNLFVIIKLILNFIKIIIIQILILKKCHILTRFAYLDKHIIIVLIVIMVDMCLISVILVLYYLKKLQETY